MSHLTQFRIAPRTLFQDEAEQNSKQECFPGSRHCDSGAGTCGIFAPPSPLLIVRLPRLTALPGGSKRGAYQDNPNAALASEGSTGNLIESSSRLNGVFTLPLWLPTTTGGFLVSSLC